MPMTTSGKQLSHEEWAAIWQSSATTDEVAERVGCTPAAARSKAWWLRKRGFELKTMWRKTGRTVTGSRTCECGQPSAPRKLVCARCWRLEAVGYDGIVSL